MTDYRKEVHERETNGLATFLTIISKLPINSEPTCQNCYYFLPMEYRRNWMPAQNQKNDMKFSVNIHMNLSEQGSI
ncbi:LOW QUALITY PROTEIN: hypothetical protein TorRG33x02_317260 [Trema orientale]|uniref:Uncharacterized protein n=1 Tax=Trema orientale TaxID=63057 RepID=A0A2P5BL10_TREOI|nr:LOW QUALITY PROTEIN: hypothetical protein TorRG33x02_317260 [Trema orientale]